MNAFVFPLLVSIALSICCNSLPSTEDTNRLTKKMEEAKTYCKTNDLNDSYYILIDMSIHSGKNRFKLIDYNTDSVLLNCLCSHGCGDHIWGADQSKTNPAFSNTPDSHLSSLGKYKIGARGWSNWGIHVNYKLHGLDSSNSKAYERLIVLHSWDAVPEAPVYPHGAPEGWGCPAISNENLKKLDSFISSENKPILLWVYN